MTDRDNDLFDTAKELAQAWFDRVGYKIDMIAETALEDGTADEIFGLAMQMMSGPERVDFLADMFMHATCVNDVAVLESGAEIETDTDVFALLVQGPEDELQSLVSGGFLTEIAEQLRESGLVHEGANILICPKDVNLGTAAQLNPADMRSVARLFARRLQTMDIRGVVREFEELTQVEQEPKLPASSSVVTRLLVGARIIPRVERDSTDLLDLPIVTGNEDRDDAEYELHDMELGKAKALFMTAIKDALMEKGGLVSVAGPLPWTDSLASAALAHLNLALSIEADFAGWGDWDRADEVHAGITGDELVVVLKKGGSAIGPVTMPMELGIHGMPVLTDYIASLAEKVFQYDDGIEVLELRRDEGMSLH